MTPIHQISRDMADDAILGKLNRNEYARWKDNEEAARKRAGGEKRQCAYCGRMFENENRNVMTCSEECRKARKKEQDIRCKAGKGRVGQIISCRYCGKKFAVNGTTQKFCSPKCRKAQENRLKRNNARTLKATCIICGREFMTSPNTKAKTCGGECLLKYRSTLAIERAKKAREAGVVNAFGEFCMPCPWETHKLDTLPPGVSSWDDPIMDPMGCGTAKVMLKFETEVERRKTA